MAMEEPGKLRQALIHPTAGAVSGCVARTVTSPLDVIKIRFQVQREPTTTWTLVGKNSIERSKYNGIFQAAKEIFKEEGLPGFWRGNVPALLLYVPYTAIQFTVLQKVKALAANSSTEDHILRPYLSYVSGALAACVATVGSYPFDPLRTILASQGEPKVYPTMRSAFADIIKRRGVRGLYAGLSPTLVEIVPYAGLQFGTYDTFMRWTKSWNQSRDSASNSPDTAEGLSSFQIFLCGSASSAFAKIVCHPLDVVKKRFQVKGLQRHPKYGVPVDPNAYKNIFDALYQIWRSEGRSGLYKGIVPSLMKAAPQGAVTFVVYELTSDWLESLLTR